METPVDLAVTFQEPTVGGLTGTQLSLLRQWEEEELCAAEIFPVSPKGPAERCIEPKEEGSRFCEDHEDREFYDYYDEYDRHKDRDYE